MDMGLTEHLNTRMINLSADLAQLAESDLDEKICLSIEIRCRELELVTRRLKLRLAFARDLGAHERRKALKVVNGGAS